MTKRHEDLLLWKHGTYWQEALEPDGMVYGNSEELVAFTIATPKAVLVIVRPGLVDVATQPFFDSGWEVWLRHRPSIPDQA